MCMCIPDVHANLRGFDLQLKPTLRMLGAGSSCARNKETGVMYLGPTMPFFLCTAMENYFRIVGISFEILSE